MENGFGSTAGMEQKILTATPLQEKNQKDIIAALCALQAEMQNPKKDTANPYFGSKYTDLAGVWDACRPLMAKNGLCLVQNPSTDGSKVTVTGMLMHISGQSISSSLSVVAKDAGAQAVGSAITYARRYQMCAMLGVASEDDDGESAENRPKEKTVAQQKGPFSKGKPFEQHKAEEAAKDAMPPQGQKDMEPFKDRIKAGKILKSGTTNGTAWTLYQIEFEGHGAFTFFDKGVYDQGEVAAKGGYEVVAHFENTAKGPTLSELEILMGEAQQNPKKSKAA